MSDPINAIADALAIASRSGSLPSANQALEDEAQRFADRKQSLGTKNLDAGREAAEALLGHAAFTKAQGVVETTVKAETHVVDTDIKATQDTADDDAKAKNEAEKSAAKAAQNAANAAVKAIKDAIQSNSRMWPWG